MFVDVDDTVVEVHGHAKQGAGFGYNKVRGLNALLATVTTSDDRAGDRGPTAPSGCLFLTAGRETSGRRRGEDRPPSS